MSKPEKSHDISSITAKTNWAQARAADPATSAWVSANAGTGKTHVLTRRVLRLLLAGTPPERILCLTYTKAAAAEMATRVFRELGYWVTKPKADLDKALSELLGRQPTHEETARARALFARTIETPGGLKVQTIHAFAERLLQRFPLEAGVPPSFTILDDVIARQLLREAIDDTLQQATDDTSSPLGQALTTAVAYAAEDSFDDVLRASLDRKDWLEHVMTKLDQDARGSAQDPVAAAARLYRKAFSLPENTTAEKIDRERASLLDDATLTRAREVLAGSSKNDREIASNFARAIAAKGDAARIEALTSAFLTKSNEPRSDRLFCAKAVRTAEPALVERLCEARDRFAALSEQRRALGVIDATIALIRLADAVLTRYTRLKARRAALDFEDLIRHTASLLRTSHSAQWVLYKLDGGLDHILVDESQDTSPQQWNIVEALAAEFFAGSGTHTQSSQDTASTPLPRTLFAVGDEKQSIYSFQGARPEQFARMGNEFRTRALAAGVPWQDIPLTLSFRTVAPVLNAVDRIFADHRRTPGLVAAAGAANDAIRHAAHRVGQAGLVEIWETETATKAESSDAWTPTGETGERPPAARLAERIADTIERMTKGGDRLLSENRPITPGDILILVRKRNPFARPMVAALKARGIPVAGADRLTLTDQLAVQDLIALGDFLTLPEDDLALANVLKSPLFGFDDDQLLAIAHGRKGTLWKALLDERSSHPAYEEAASLLRDWRRRADFLPPFEFLAGVLERDGMRQRLLARLGAEAADSIDELMNLAIAFDDSAPPSLTGFLTWLRESNREIKRDMEHGRDEVRIMTVHGAKGLEAPIVFLPDTCAATSPGRTTSLYPLAMPPAPPHTPSAFVWQIKGSSHLAPITAGREAIYQRETEERNRLLYVAMTRARDRLYISGFEGRKTRSPDSWYDLMRSGLEGQLQTADDGTGRKVERLQTAQEAEPKKPKSELTEAHDPLPLENWARLAAPREPQLTMPLAPSRLAPYDVDESGEPIPHETTAGMPPQEPPAATPRTLTAGNRFLRGTLTHALLEHLPGIPAHAWPQAAEAYIEVRGKELPPRVRASIVTETLAILRDTGFACLFGPSSRAEVAIAAEIPRPSGSGPALKLNGSIDRLAIDGDHVYIIDYKTNRPPPDDVDQVADAYLFQLAAYRLALAQLFPNKSLKAGILWTNGPRLMEISIDRLDKYERMLWELDPSSLDASWAAPYVPGQS